MKTHAPNGPTSFVSLGGLDLKLEGAIDVAGAGTGSQVVDVEVFHGKDGAIRTTLDALPRAAGQSVGQMKPEPAIRFFRLLLEKFTSLKLRKAGARQISSGGAGD